MAETNVGYLDEDQEEDYEIQRRPSVLLPQLQDSEQEFFELVTAGNVSEVRKFLIANPNLNINCVNFEAVSALHIAVKSRNVQMVEFLLSQPNIETGDTALQAVKADELRIVIAILDHMQKINMKWEYAGVTHSTDFLDDTTPIEVAAYHGHYEIIRLLLDRGHIMEKPHPPYCFCEEVCKPERETKDALTSQMMRIFRYTAWANPAYICLTSEDPILVSFELSVELRHAAEYERILYDSYRQIADTVAKFATELIGSARTTEEVELILRQPTGWNIVTDFEYPRLLLAMHFKMKTFVAHHNVQQIVKYKWEGNLPWWRQKSVFAKVMSVFPRIPMLPIICCWILLLPNSPRSKQWSIPVNKFLSHNASYIIFLILVFAESNIDKSNQLRGPPDSGFEIILLVYVIAYIWSSLRLCFNHGPARFFKSLWNWYEAGMLFLFLLTFCFWGAAMLDVKKHGQRDLERKYWHQYDPTLIAEGTFCIATIMAFMKLLFICQLNHTLGPLQMSLGKMISDVTKFLLIFGIIIFSFTAGLDRLYEYYDGMVQIDDESKLKTQQAESFVNFAATLKTLFWAIFCMSPIESADVVIENLPGETETETIINRHNFTETIGYIAFAGFDFIVVIVVLNMLIACMSNTFIKVTDNVAVEWTFGRTQVYIDFMVHSPLPAPLNLLPTATTFSAIAEFIKALIKPTAEKKARWNLKRCCYVESFTDDFQEDYAITMTHLVQRYFRKKELEMPNTESESLQKELSELRNILRDVLAPT